MEMGSFENSVIDGVYRMEKDSLRHLARGALRRGWSLKKLHRRVNRALKKCGWDTVTFGRFDTLIWEALS